MFTWARLFVEQHERKLSVLAFVFGFIWDSLTLTRVDGLLDNILLASYLFATFASIVLLNAHATGRLFQGRFSRRVIDFARFLLPFAFGGLFSGFLIFYSRSGSFFASAPFLLLLTTLFLGNEFLRSHYQRFIFQMSVFFVTLFSYAVLIVPVLVGSMGSSIFMVSGLASLIIFSFALRFVARFAREEVENSKYSLRVIVVIIFITFNVLYFNNMIPPIPLSLKEIGVYHGITRTRAGEYQLTFEEAPWYAFGKKTSGVFHLLSGESVYAFSSIFAPTSLNTEIQHRWSYFDEGSGEWVSTSIVGFPISGGRNDGYRGYSVKENVTPGTWRVDVETLRGQVIGRFNFVVEDVASPPLLKTQTR